MPNPYWEVESGDCLTTRGRISTAGASTCIILAALNTETGAGLLGHLTCDDIEQGELLDESVDAIARLGPGKSTQIRLAGGAIYTYNYACPESEDNQKVEQRIREMALQNGIPLPNITVSWLWGNDEASATVDCHEGTITVKESFWGDDGFGD